MNAAVAFPSTVRHRPAAVSTGKASQLTSRDAVRKQLSEILQSESFVRASRMKRFLEFIVEETLAGRAAQLCEYSIGVSVFDRSESFEPGLDPIVRNDARRLRQKLLEYYQGASFRNSGRILIEVPKGSYVPTFSRPRPRVETRGVRYRLTVSLTRTNDRCEMWAVEQELCGDDLDLCAPEAWVTLVNQGHGRR